jgi:hypothetical protein
MLEKFPNYLLNENDFLEWLLCDYSQKEIALVNNILDCRYVIFRNFLKTIILPKKQYFYASEKYYWFDTDTTPGPQEISPEWIKKIQKYMINSFPVSLSKRSLYSFSVKSILRYHD